MPRPMIELSRIRLGGAIRFAALVTAIFVVPPLLMGEAPNPWLVLPAIPLGLLAGFFAWPSTANPATGRGFRGTAGDLALTAVIINSGVNALVLFVASTTEQALLLVLAVTLLGFGGYHGWRYVWRRPLPPGRPFGP